LEEGISVLTKLSIESMNSSDYSSLMPFQFLSIGDIDKIDFIIGVLLVCGGDLRGIVKSASSSFISAVPSLLPGQIVRYKPTEESLADSYVVLSALEGIKYCSNSSGGSSSANDSCNCTSKEEHRFGDLVYIAPISSSSSSSSSAAQEDENKIDHYEKSKQMKDNDTFKVELAFANNLEAVPISTCSQDIFKHLILDLSTSDGIADRKSVGAELSGVGTWLSLLKFPTVDEKNDDCDASSLNDAVIEEHSVQIESLHPCN
jgi:hypothetical protein